MKNDKVKFWPTIFGYMKKYKSQLVLTVIFSMFTGFFVAVQPLVIKYIVDDAISNTSLLNDRKIQLVIFFCIIYLVATAGRIISWIIAHYNLLNSLEGAMFELKCDLFEHVQHLCMKFYDSTASGELYNNLMGSPMNNIKTYLNQMMIGVPYQAVSFVVSLTALFSYDWLLTLLLLGISVIMVIINYYSRPKIRRMSKEFISKETAVSKYVTDMFHGMDSIKVYSVEEDTIGKFKEFAGNLRKEGIKVAFRSNLEAFKPEGVMYLGTAIVYFVGAVSCIYRGVSVGALYAFINSMGMILGTLNTWLTYGLQKSQAEAGLDKIMNIMKTKPTTPEVEDGHKRDIEIEKASAVKKNLPCIEFSDVTFAYDEKPIFDKFSCKINYCESIGLVGSSGSGKSTLTKLANRLYDPQGGTVYLHGKDIKDYGTHDVRKSFGVVPQNPFMFRGSIMENIRIARPEASNLEVIKAMEMAHVHEFVNELPNGWHTVIGDGGLNLSGGQKQRIAIARAILGNPDILIFDEATSALDNVSEMLIQQAMEELMKTHTVLIVAHRLTTIRNVDRILVFKDGKIVEEGTFEELSENDGAFKELLTFKN